MKAIDIFITAYLRSAYTEQTIKYLKERTNLTYRLFLIDQGGNELLEDQVDYYIRLRPTTNIHTAWNIAKEMAESEYFITSDNDIYVPDLGDNDWLGQVIRYMDERPDYGAISLHPHVLIGAASFDPTDPEDVKEVNMAGAVMRIMRTEAVRKVGGWEHKLEKGRNHEERTISSRLIDNGYKVGRTTRIRAYHPFGGKDGNWGYPVDMSPEEHGHNPDLKDYVVSFDRPENYDEKTWLTK
jgi:GT2 family glycosyltransferase